MSRYTERIKSIEFAWGFDENLMEFFFQKFDDRISGDEEDNPENMIFSIGTRFVVRNHPKFKIEDYSHKDILKVMKYEMEKHGFEIPTRHIESLSKNEPF